MIETNRFLVSFPPSLMLIVYPSLSCRALDLSWHRARCLRRDVYISNNLVSCQLWVI